MFPVKMNKKLNMNNKYNLKPFPVTYFCARSYLKSYPQSNNLIKNAINIIFIIGKVSKTPQVPSSLVRLASGNSATCIFVRVATERRAAKCHQNNGSLASKKHVQDAHPPIPPTTPPLYSPWALF